MLPLVEPISIPIEETRLLNHEINLRTMTFDGQKGRKVTVGRTSVRRSVPQLIRAGDQLVMAWTDSIGGQQKVVSVAIDIPGLYD